ncbi:phage terminase large subunit [Nitratireductor indicus]|uniref:phage terminase large subunit n=1 Tax=Nitratireductor indicus TaxID=721133 RepID=UPI0028740600|nr:phage terminase large subunit [Nitratireductor indicus]MDS1138589.1 phage terminase large subunit [Nitratireductor indicus]
MTFQLTEKQKELKPLLSSNARHVLLYGGSRSGKTFLLCYAIATRALRAAGSRHGIFRKTNVAVKQSIGSDTFPKVLQLAYPEARFRWKEQDGYFLFENGSEVWLSGLDDKERVDKVLGKEFATIYENEASEISYDAHGTLSSRLAQRVPVTVGDGEYLAQKNYIDLNPTTQSHWTYKMFVQGIEPIEKRPLPREDYVWGVANPQDNAENLDPAYIAGLKLLPKSKRARFFEGKFSGDSSDALWTRADIDNSRLFVINETDLPDFKRVVVAIDPAISTETGSNETGIIAAAIDTPGQGYVLADGSGVFKPDEWARRAIHLYNYYHADLIVAEANQGGEMVKEVIHAQNPNIHVKLVKATRGKYVRAEPVAALYARGRVRHVGEFQELEDQMCVFTADFDRKAEGYSPDRMDALVWAMTELFPNLIADRGRKMHESQTVAHGDYDVLNVEQSAFRMNRQVTAGIRDYDPF